MMHVLGADGPGASSHRHEGPGASIYHSPVDPGLPGWHAMPTTVARSAQRHSRSGCSPTHNHQNSALRVDSAWPHRKDEEVVSPMSAS